MPSFSPVFRKGKDSPVLPFAVWSAVSDHLDSTRNTWDFLNRVGKCPHFLWNPSTGEEIEGISLERRATFLPTSGIQIAVMADPEKPFTDAPVIIRGLIFKALESLGVPQVWPFGPPSLYGIQRKVFEPSLSLGYYSANQLNPDWRGIGSIDVRKMYGTDA